jgi:hypothetical protein
MAQPVTCDTGCGTLAVVMNTMIETGDVQAYCGPCYVDICVAMLAGTGKLQEIIDAAIAASKTETKPAKKTASRARKGAAASTTAPAQDTGPTGESTPAQQAHTTA